MTAMTAQPPIAEDQARLVEAMREAASAVEATLDALLPSPGGPYGRVCEAMRYAVFAGGKRFRPVLTLAAAEALGGPRDSAIRAGAAIEALHTYSLIHDDLPCMDDDDLRRGMPTAHRRFDEATAVLAGDALLTWAFEALSAPQTHADPLVRAELVGGLARAAGAAGMVGGQMMDMLAPDVRYSEDEVALLQRLKTGALIRFSCEAGAILAQAGETRRRQLGGYAEELGLLFQITDDLIDATGDEAKAGKAVGKDQAQGKATFISIHGLDGARRKAEALAQSARARLDDLGDAAGTLRALPQFLLDRAS